MADAAVITALAPWFGSKRTLAARIAAEIGPHRCYWEPFCGSMAVLLAKQPCPMETVNDLHGDLVNLARVIQSSSLGPMLYRRLRRVLAAKPLVDEAAARWAAYGRRTAPVTPCVDRAFDFFTSSWLGRNGVCGTQSYNQGFSRRFTSKGGHAAKRWDGAVASLPAWRRRLRNVTILNDDAFEWLGRIEDAPGVVIYADPPYVEKGATYVHDFDAADHERLACELRRFRRTRVVVSYYEHPEVRRLYEGWTFVPTPVPKSLVCASRLDREVDAIAPEVLIINGPSYTAPGLWGGP